MLITRHKRYFQKNLGEDPTQWLDGATLTAEQCIQLILLQLKQDLFSLHYNRSNSYLFLNGIKSHKFKAIDSEIVANSLCLWNISEGFSVDNMKKNSIDWILQLIIY